MPNNKKEQYNARHLSVLEGLEAVRKRPGMYIGSTDQRGVMHCLWEIIDNSVDEALEGHCTEITVTINDDYSVSVSDNGRGIPVDEVPGLGLSGVEVVFTKLHAGGKFGTGSYSSSGGLHGVGASVVNALSARLDVEVDRGGKTYAMSFRRGEPGIFDDRQGLGPQSPFTPFTDESELRVVGKAPKKKTGTRVRFWVDFQIFPKSAATGFSWEELLQRARQTAFLVPGLTINCFDKREENQITKSVLDQEFPAEHDSTPSIATVSAAKAEENTDETATTVAETGPNFPVLLDKRSQEETFCSTGGVVDFVDYLAPDAPVTDIWQIKGSAQYQETVQQLDPNTGHLSAQEVTRECLVDIAIRWGNGYATVEKSFVNIVATPMGGTHLAGFEAALIKVLRAQIEKNKKSKRLKLNARDGKIEKEDILAGLTAIITVRIPEPQFEGQTKEILGTAQVRTAVQGVVADWLNQKFASGKREDKQQTFALMEKVVGEMRARISARIHKEISRRKNALETSSLPAKLADCRTNDVASSELFIVEGDSALGTAKKARSGEFQALLPIRGKILNTQKASTSDTLANAECAAIIQVIGAGSGRSFTLEQARYGKIILMTDADVDGAHIRTLLLTLFFRYMRPLIEAGRLYAAVPPLHRIEIPAQGRKKKEIRYTYSEEQLHKELAALRKANRRYKEPIQRYKGLGEMDADQLAETTMDPECRMLRQITVDDEVALREAEEIFELLMGTQVAPRRDFIVAGASELDRNQIDA